MRDIPSLPPQAASKIIPWQDLRIEELWSELGGPPVRWHGADRGRARAWWRQGLKLSVSINRTSNLWHDFATGDGGRCLQLVEVALEVNRHSALQWLGERYGAPGEFTDVDRAERAARERSAGLAALWRKARISELERLKAETSERLSLPGSDADERYATWLQFISTSRQLHAVERLDGEAVRVAMNVELRARTVETAALIHEQRDFEAGAVDLTAFIAAALGWTEVQAANA